MDGAKLNRRIIECRQLVAFRTFYKEFKEVINGKCIYTQRIRKPRVERIWDNMVWLLKNHEVNRFYNTYGLDVKDFRDSKDFIPYRKFSIERNDANLSISGGGDYNGYNYVCVLRDKSVFASYVSETVGSKYAVPVLGITTGETARVYRNNDISLTEYLNTRRNKDTILKKVSGECGDGVYLVEWKEENKSWFVNRKPVDLQSFVMSLGGDEYIIQDRVIQHDEINKINPYCVNTIRIVTVADKKKNVHVFAKFLRVGTGQGVKDNRATGGYGISINEQGVLSNFAISHNDFITAHPDTGFIFGGFQIPYWDDVVKLVITMHSYLSDIESIGWDVAITPNGPVLIEGNDNWEISGPQDMEGGLKERWNQIRG